MSIGSDEMDLFTPEGEKIRLGTIDNRKDFTHPG
jgi:hypothetical protein